MPCACLLCRRGEEAGDTARRTLPHSTARGHSPRPRPPIPQEAGAKKLQRTPKGGSRSHRRTGVTRQNKRIGPKLSRIFTSSKASCIDPSCSAHSSPSRSSPLPRRSRLCVFPRLRHALVRAHGAPVAESDEVLCGDTSTFGRMHVWCSEMCPLRCLGCVCGSEGWCKTPWWNLTWA